MSTKKTGHERAIEAVDAEIEAVRQAFHHELRALEQVKQRLQQGTRPKPPVGRPVVPTAGKPVVSRSSMRPPKVLRETAAKQSSNENPQADH